MNILQRYNIALLLTNTNLASDIIRVSRKYFLQVQDRYILGSDGLPHITLCQFKAKNVDGALAIYESFAKENESYFPVSAKIEKFHIRPGQLINAGTFIAEYKVIPSPELITLQARCVEMLARYDIKTLTPFEGYSPHITLARLSEKTKKAPSKTDVFFIPNLEFRLAFGLSTEEGVFVKELLS